MMPHPTNRQTSEQIRATHAWNAVESMLDHSERDRGEYGTLARKLAAMIQTNGLANSIAFLKSKKDAQGNPKVAHSKLAEHLQSRLQYALHRPAEEGIMEFIMGTSTDHYRRATTEAIVFAGWLKRFVEAKGWKSSEGD